MEINNGDDRKEGVIRMTRSALTKLVLVAAVALAVAAPGWSEDAPATSGRLALKKIEPLRSYRPVALVLAAARPEAVKKEPEYKAAPKYGTIKLGNGPQGAYLFALEDTQDGSRIFIDKNRNGDLSDDGDGAWNTKKEVSNSTATLYGPMELTLRASYGTTDTEKSSADTIIHIYHRAGLNALLTYTGSMRTGTVMIDGKPFTVTMIEDGASGLYNRPAASIEEARKTMPVRLTGTWTGDKGTSLTLDADIRAPFKLGDKVYEAQVSDDGASLKVEPTTKAALDLRPKAPERPPLLKAGVPAPDFTVPKWGGGELKLSDYRGKIVILDFWATWCGPCQRSLPHVEKVYQAVKSQAVAVIGVCVWDKKDAYDAWVPKNKNKYTFQFAFDPEGRGENNVAKKLYKVSAIPTTYIIDKDGKVADAILGYDENDKRIEAALEKLGVKVKETETEK